MSGPQAIENNASFLNEAKRPEEYLKEPETPESIKEHQKKYKEGIWRTYTLHELGMWIHLFVRRALHRADKIKARKDITDAQNYLNMMQSHIDTVRKQVSQVVKVNIHDEDCDC